jgi:hypothetical protein
VEHHSLRRTRAGAALLAAVACVLASSATAWADSPTPSPSASPAPMSKAVPATFGLQPATSGKVDSRSAFSFQAEPGATASDEVAVQNFAHKPITLQLYSADGYNTSDGGFSVLPAGDKSTQVGAWVGLPSTTVTVPARGVVIVPFTVRVPSTALPGDHEGGIVASLTTIGTRPNGEQFKVYNRVGDRVLVRVTGPLTAHLSLTNVHAQFEGSLNPDGKGSVRVTYSVTNTGNVLLGATQLVTVKMLFGSSARTSGLPVLPGLLPGNGVEQTVILTGVWPQLRGKATVTIQPLAPAGVSAPSASEAIETASFWAIPWSIVALLLLVALVLAGWWYWRHRRAASGGSSRGKRARGKVPPTPQPQKELVS